MNSSFHTIEPIGMIRSKLTQLEDAPMQPDRPNPIGLHRVSVLEVAEHKLKVAPLEAIDGTPIVDIKPVLAASTSER